MSNHRIVYSTDHGRMCPDCHRPAESCQCKSARSTTVKGDGTVRLSRETKGRNGKTVTVATGLPVGDDALSALLKELKRECGCGGTAKDGRLELQGERVDFLRQKLIAKGFKVKG